MSDLAARAAHMMTLVSRQGRMPTYWKVNQPNPPKYLMGLPVKVDSLIRSGSLILVSTEAPTE
jgi:hypothetical protein